MVGAVLFDCDGVLVDSEILAIEVETALLAEAGLTYDIAEFKTRFMGMSDAAFYAALDADSLARLGRPLPKEFPAECQDRLRREVRGRMKEVAGARSAVEALRGPKAVASSSTLEKLNFKLSKVGLWELFSPHIYSADHVAQAKPEPDLFLHAAGQLGVAPADCLVLEDSVNGIRAALAAGMRVWGFAGGGHMDEGVIRRLKGAGSERIVMSWPHTHALFVELGIVRSPLGLL
jgi:HAD superfamily hydrolase (TIGR01509 family)